MSKKEASKRFYVVTEKGDGTQCLVEAATKTSALSRAAAHYCEVRVASPQDIVTLMQNKADLIEIAPGEQEDLPLPDSEPAAEPEGEIL